MKSADSYPIWPNNVAGSISHSHDLAVAVISNKYNLIGVDIEYKNKERSPQIFERICTKNEQTWAKNNPRERGLQIFSIKEAIYKAFYLEAKLTFMDVELNWNGDNFSCTLLKDINQNYKKGFVFKAHQSEYNNYILSIVSVAFLKKTVR